MTYDNLQPVKWIISMHMLRRLIIWTTLLVVIIILQSHYVFFSNSNFVKNTWGALRNQILDNADVGHSGPLFVLLIAYARTGSSFVGDFMQSFPNTFYYFEPLHFIEESMDNSSLDRYSTFLYDLLNCNISQIDGFIDWNKKHKSYMKFQRNIQYWNECSKVKSCFNGSYIDNFCLNKTIRIAKTIRLSLTEASKLFLLYPNLNLKIIYLTRDVRGTMNSRLKKPVKSWCSKFPICFNPYNYCTTLQYDVKTVCNLLANRPHDFMVIRYEDMSTNPYDIAINVSKLLGLRNVPKKVLDFLKTHTSFTGNIKHQADAMGLEVPYTTFRNSAATSMSWRKQMTIEYVMSLQSTCKTFLTAFGYHFYNTISTLRSNFDMNKNLKDALALTCDNST